MVRQRDAGSQPYLQFPGGSGQRRVEDLSAPKPNISIILPVLNEAPILAEALTNLPRSPDLEFILVDGGSVDATRAVAARFPFVRLITAPRGRGSQMNAGARLARGEFLVFLHIDTGLRRPISRPCARPPGTLKSRPGPFTCA